jgi:hypothetical protein
VRPTSGCRCREPADGSETSGRRGRLSVASVAQLNPAMDGGEEWPTCSAATRAARCGRGYLVARLASTMAVGRSELR